MNRTVFELLNNCVSQRGAASITRLNRKTIVRKFLFLGRFAKAIFPYTNALHSPASEVQFDDLETFEHSKYKPLSVMMLVEHGSRRIIGFRVAKMPAKGLLAALARKKYGVRKDERKASRNELFEEHKPLIRADAIIKSDENPHYQADVKRHFPKAKHLTYKGRRACVVGQGELKAGKFDPLFSLNHTYAMLRARISRLVRKTWCTTKKAECLDHHLYAYALYHNLVLIQKKVKSI